MSDQPNKTEQENNYEAIYQVVDNAKTSRPKEIDEEKTVAGNSNREFQRYDGIAVDQELFNRDSKTIMFYSEKEIPDDIRALMDRLMGKMVVGAWKIRTNLSNRNTLDEVISPSYPFKEVFLPFPGFNKDADAIEKRPSDMAYRVAIYLYLNTKRDATVDTWNGMVDIAKLFGGNQAQLLLGKDLKTPVKYIVTYSPCGTTKLSRDTDWDAVGFEIPKLIKMASLLNIKFYNLGNKASRDEFNVLIDTLN